MPRLAFLLLLCLPWLHAQTPETTKTAKIVELFQITKTDQMQKQLLTQMIASFDPAHRESGAKLSSFLAEKLSWEEMREQYIKLYDETFTEEEISGILTFYQSPAGQAFLAKMPVMMPNIVALVQKRMAELKPEIERLAKEGLPAAK